jgi:hypothetical protein
LASYVHPSHVTGQISEAAPSAQAHTLTKKKARGVLKPVAAQTAPRVAPAIVAKLPGAAIAKSGVGPCAIAKNRHRAECV